MLENKNQLSRSINCDIDDILFLSDKKLSSKLNDWKENKSERHFYGLHFYLIYISKLSRKDSPLHKLVCDFIEDLDITDPSYHWEFINYAYRQLNEIDPSHPFVKYTSDKMRFNNATNWKLLRIYSQLFTNRSTSYRELQSVVRRNCNRHGLIRDSKNDNSIQYHSFSLYLLIKIRLDHDIDWLDNHIFRAADYLEKYLVFNRPFVTGRGQQQLFGYASAIMCFSILFRTTKKEKYLFFVKNLLKVIKEIHSKYGCLPLVIGPEGQADSNVDLNSVNYTGWYGYNNYCDYLGFLVFSLMSSKAYLNDNSNLRSIFIEQVGTYNIYFGNYTAIFGLGSRDWSSNHFMPRIEKSGNVIIPSIGGEQYLPSTFSEDHCCLPTINGKIGRVVFKYRSKNKIILITSKYVLIRTIVFEVDRIILIEKVYSIGIKKLKRFLLVDSDRNVSGRYKVVDTVSTVDGEFQLIEYQGESLCINL